MITDSFEIKGEPIFNPGAFYGPQVRICDIAIVTFSRTIFSEVLKLFPNERIGELQAANKIKPLYVIRVGDLTAAFYLSEIGSALAANDVIEVNWRTGAEKFIMFGSAGALDIGATAGKYVIPTAAYRDEGMSYHYAPPSDYIGIPTADRLAGFFEEEGLPYVKGKVWTTDAFYMETREQVRKRKAEGCLAVEMELAGVQAVCDYYGFELFDFLVTGDVVDQPEYTPDGLEDANHSLDKFHIALKIAERIRNRKEND